MSNISVLQRAIAKRQADLQKLERELAAEAEKQFSVLPRQFGLKSIDALIKALTPYASPRMKALLKGGPVSAPTTTAPKAAKAAPAAKAPRKRRKRAKITEEIRAGVIAAVKAGGKTNQQIADEFRISLPSVGNIKAAAKLTAKR
jgi:DNA-binding NarL/FixJ family response regulator